MDQLKALYAKSESLVRTIGKEKWINNQIASYFIFGCSRIQELEDIVTKAKSFLQKLTELNASELAYVSLGYPEVLLFRLKTIESMEKLKTDIEKLTDEQLSHLLLGLSLMKKTWNEERKEIVAMVKGETIVRFRNRQITELDKKVTKEFLDLLLLLRVFVYSYIPKKKKIEPKEKRKTRKKRLKNTTSGYKQQMLTQYS